jgi:DNA-binding MarR family transcriptional regulator
MKKCLSLISKINENGNKFILDKLKEYNVQGLVPSHGDILICLYNNDRITMKDIAEKINKTRPTVTVLVDKLEKLGFVTREISDKDNRYTHISLTQKGKIFEPIFIKISKELNNKIYKNLSDEETEIFEKLLEKIMINIKN